MIFETSQKALDLGYDGLIIESHIDPDNAWSDAKQQVTPDVLSKIKSDLKVKTKKKMISLISTYSTKSEKVLMM